MKKFAFCLLFVVFFTSFAFGQQRFSVYVIIYADDDIKPAVNSFITRQLRSLGDVDIAEKNTPSSIRFSVLASKIKSKNGNHLGYVMSYSAIRLISCNGDLFFESIGDSVTFGDPDSLSSLAEELIVSFDQYDLSILRKYRKA